MKKHLSPEVAKRMIKFNIIMALVCMATSAYWYVDGRTNHMTVMLLLSVFFATGILRYKRYVKQVR